MPIARPESSDSRVIAHVDMDCFYVQVEQRKQPNLRGIPTAVVQYNSWKGGGLIAVSYEARKYGVKRSMRGDEAKEVCPQIQLVQVPVARGKADLSTYRNAGSEVVSILARKGRCERASIDEVYLDLTESAEAMLAETPPWSLESIDEEAAGSHILGLDVDGRDEKKVREWLSKSNADHRDTLLACGALIVSELRLQVLKETQFTCSAGIAHNKMLAKLASGMNKPAQQTVVPFSSVKALLEPLPIKKMKQLGGKLGSCLQIDLGVNTVGDLLQFSEEILQERYGINTGTWLWNIARGINGEEVQGRLLPKSHGSGKTFPGPRALKTIDSVEHWIHELCEELNERLHSDLEQNKRVAHTLTLHARAYKFNGSNPHKKFPSKSCPLIYGTSKIQEDALNLFRAGLREYLGSYGVKSRGNQYNGWAITALSVSASNIVSKPAGTCSILKYFHNRNQSNDNFIEDDAALSLSGTECYPGLHPTAAQAEFGEEESKITHALPRWDEQDDEKKFLSISELGESFSVETSLSSAAECCSEQNQFQPNQQFPREITNVGFASHGVKPHGQKRHTSKEKGTSILRFFQNCTTSSLHQSDVKTVGESKAFSASGSTCDEQKNGELAQESKVAETESEIGRCSSGQRELGINAWGYKIDEINPSVLNELPQEIREEVWGWLRPQKRANTLKQGSRISHYFLPTKKS